MNLIFKIAGGTAMAANAAGTFVVIALIAVVNYDIVARNVFNRPFLGAVEVVQFSMVLIVFFPRSVDEESDSDSPSPD